MRWLGRRGEGGSVWGAMRTWHLVKYLHISNHCPDCSCHLQAANPADNKTAERRKTPPHGRPTQQHTLTDTCTPLQKEHCVCCLPAQFVSNLICILTTFCVWLKQCWARGGEVGELSSKNTGQRATKGVTATCAKCVKRQNNNTTTATATATCHSANSKLESKAESAWSPRPATLAAGAARKLRTN